MEREEKAASAAERERLGLL